MSTVEAYLDIETTGLSAQDCDITVVGIYVYREDETRFVQLLGEDITSGSILNALEGIDILYTYNGSRFDIPFIYSRLGINLAKLFKHCDLMYDCWRCNLYGGFKSVEIQLGIDRKLVEIDGYEAVRLWWRYFNSFDLDALNLLLEYNKEDVINLKKLRDKLL
jgi:uncharacterized protein YprB with RNaseH-like and TPR domain